MSRRVADSSFRYAAILALGAGTVCVPVGAQERLTVDVGAGAGVATNPFLQSGSTEASPSLNLQVTPTYIVDREFTRFRLRGDVSVAQYLRDYGTNDSYSLDADATHRLSSATQVSARVGYINSVVGGFNDAGVIGRDVIIPGLTPEPDLVDPVPVVGPDLPIGGLPGVITDPSLGGLGERRQSYQAGLGLQTMLSPRDRISFDLSANASRFDGEGFNEFNYFAQRTAYSRVLDEGTEISANILVGRSDYAGTRLGDSTIIQPSVGFSKRLSSGLRLGLEAGVSIVRLNDLTGTDTSTGASGSVNLCQQDTRWNACLSASRSYVPSSVQGVRPQTAISASGGFRLSARDTFSLRASYSYVGDVVGDPLLTDFADRSTSFFSAKGDYARIISPRLSAFASAGVSRADDDLISRDANLEARVGLRYRFGAIR